MKPLGPYVLTVLAVVALGAFALSGEPAAAIALLVVALLAITALGWEAAHR